MHFLKNKESRRVYICQNKLFTILDIQHIKLHFVLKKVWNVLNIEEYINTLIEVLSSWIILKIDDYNSSMYYENPSYIYACYREGRILEN